ncbi:MAG TPA: hypothetical protein VJS44_05210 [Pyrinomonadaceae bacterium]|nr:hypothetical protein [Pyrinomonadaceae bacterium]
MTREITKTQIDRLGERLKKGSISDDDLRLLDQYRRSFSEAYDIVVGTIRKELNLEPTGRPAKSTTSISDKLRRESIRLTQIQDIAGCRLIVPDIAGQDSVVDSLKNLFGNVTVVDRRQRPSHGYRAVHVIVNLLNKTIEIQVRTSLQHIWAELSEKFSDVVSPAIKYGGGDEGIQTTLMDWSSLFAKEESLEVKIAHIAAQLSTRDNITDEDKQRMVNIENEMNSFRQKVFKDIRAAMKELEEIKGGSNDISD